MSAQRDYYELLGVARTATEVEIKKAFRAKARELHPDVSENPDAEPLFKEMVEAYEVLSDSERRELYDRYGHAGLRSRGYTPSSFDFGTLGDLFSAFFGDDLFGVGGRRGAGAGRRRRRRGRDRARRVRPRRHQGRPGPRRRAVRDLRRERGGAGHEPGHLPDLRGRRPGAGGLEHRLRPVHPRAPLRALRRCRTDRRDAVQDLRGRRPHDRGADAPGRHPGRDPRRPADPHRRRGPRRRARRPRGRPVRARPRPAGPALRPRGARPDLDRRPDDDAGRARRRPSPCRRSTATSSSSSSPARSPTRCASCAAPACRCSRAAAAATTACSSPSPCRAASREEQRGLLEQFERSADDETYSKDEGFFDKLKSAFR